MNCKLEPKTIIAIVVNIIIWILYCLSAICELIIFDCVSKQKDIACIRFFEISNSTATFLTFIAIPFLPDCVFAFFGIIVINKLYANPFTVFYNLVMGILCILANTVMVTTDCSFQKELKACFDPIFGMVNLILFAGIFHFIIALLSIVLCGMNKDWWIIWRERFGINKDD